MNKNLFAICLFGLISCNQKDGNSNHYLNEESDKISTEESINFDSIKPIQLEHPTDSTFDFTSVNLDSNMIELEKNLAELKEELEKAPENGRLENLIIQLENDLELLKQIDLDLKERELEE